MAIWSSVKALTGTMAAVIRFELTSERICPFDVNTERKSLWMDATLSAGTPIKLMRISYVYSLNPGQSSHRIGTSAKGDVAAKLDGFDDLEPIVPWSS